MTINTTQQRFEADVLDAIADAHKAGVKTKYMARYLRDAVKALVTPELWEAHRTALKRGETPWH